MPGEKHDTVFLRFDAARQGDDAAIPEGDLVSALDDGLFFLISRTGPCAAGRRPLLPGLRMRVQSRCRRQVSGRAFAFSCRNGGDTSIPAWLWRFPCDHRGKVKTRVECGKSEQEGRRQGGQTKKGLESKPFSGETSEILLVLGGGFLLVALGCGGTGLFVAFGATGLLGSLGIFATRAVAFLVATGLLGTLGILATGASAFFGATGLGGALGFRTANASRTQGKENGRKQEEERLFHFDFLWVVDYSHHANHHNFFSCEYRQDNRDWAGSQAIADFNGLRGKRLHDPRQRL